MKVLAADFDDEFDDEEPLPAIGTCKALYTFDGKALRHRVPRAPALPVAAFPLSPPTFLSLPVVLLGVSSSGCWCVFGCLAHVVERPSWSLPSLQQSKE